MEHKDTTTLYEELNKISTEVHFAADDYLNGKNAAIRKSGSKKLEFLENRVNHMIENYPAVWECFKEVGGTSQYSDFFESKYFSGEIQKLTDCLGKKILNR